MTAAIVMFLVLATSIMACHFIAKKRGSDPVLWGVMGAIISPLAILFVFMSKVGRQK